MTVQNCSDEFNTANFGVITYKDSRGRTQKAYAMTPTAPDLGLSDDFRLLNFEESYYKNEQQKVIETQ